MTTNLYARGLLEDRLYLGHEGFPQNRGFQILQDNLPSSILLGVDSLINRKTQLHGDGYTAQSQLWIWIFLSVFLRFAK